MTRVDATSGLSSAEASQRLLRDGPNELPTERPRSLLRQTWSVVREPMLLLLLAAGAINFLLAEVLDAAILASFVLLVIGISLYQRHKTENALGALRSLSSPRALVLRDGARARIAGREVVPGDLVILAEGDRVPADGVLIEAINLYIDESALTGESVAVSKSADAAETAMGPPGGDDSPWVFSGTLIVRGHGLACIKATGASTALGRIGGQLRNLASPRTRLQREFDRLVWAFAALGSLAAIAVILIYGFTRGQWLEAGLAGITTAMAVLPEEIPVVFSLFLALGAWRMSRVRVLTRSPPAIETLGSATVVCVDKTGTLTRNAMTVREIGVSDETHVLDGTGISANLDRLVSIAASACPVEGVDPMDRAFVDLAERIHVPTLRADSRLVQEYALSDELRCVGHVWRRRDNSLDIAVKGAPEDLLALSDMPAAEREGWHRRIDVATADGLRVLGVGIAHLESTRDLPSSLEGLQVEFLGIAGLQDPVRDGVPEAIAACHRAGVRVVMITGDYPGTALAIAREIGIDTGPGCVTGDVLAAMDDVECARSAGRVNVFARMVPEQKLRLVRALQADGEVVGMTGDGVNDAPALRASDIGIAMGARGTDVAREAADLVIVDDDFTSITAGIRQGRGIFANLRKALTYVVAVHVPIFGMSLIPVMVADWPIVLMPVEVALLQFIIDPACSISFEAEPVDPKVMDEPPRSLESSMFGRSEMLLALAQGLVVLAVVFGAYLWSLSSGQPDDVVRSFTFVTLVSGNAALILVNRSRHVSVWETVVRRRNPALLFFLSLGLVVITVIMVVPWLRDALGLGELSLAEWLLAVGLGLLAVVWFEVLKWVRRREPAARDLRHLR